MNKVFKVIIVSAVLLMTLTVQAKDSTMDLLVKSFANIKTYQAGFVQTLYDANQEEIQKSSGLVYIKKPGKFRWDYKKPFEQLILSNAKDLWVFDVEMDQATVKPVDSILASAPAILLGSDRPIYEAFELKDLGEREGLAWVELIPKDKETDFKKIYVAMDDDKIAVMELRDNFEQVTQIQFHHVKINVEIDDSKFEFTPPKGVDVLGQAGLGQQ